MSSWVEKQQQDAFRLYQRYLGISLHFRDGTDYDYTLYNGGTKATLAAFLRKPKTERLPFMQLNGRLSQKGINPEEFFFANARYEQLDLRKMMTIEAMNTFWDWQAHYGTNEVFHRNAIGRFRRVTKGNPDEEAVDLVIRLLGGSDDYLELIAYILQQNPEIGTPVRIAAEDNILKKLMLTKVIKCQKFYSYLGII